MEESLVYGNWIRKRILLILGGAALGLGALALMPLGALVQILLAGLSLILLVSFLIPLYSYVMFSQRGGKYQEKIYHLIIQRLGRPLSGRILDIGSGNGVLAVTLAQIHSEVDVTGMDYWGKDWEYSKGVCERNARIGRVQDRVHFQKGDAAALEFGDETFDGAISNLTFHEVRSVTDKREVAREALRVVKKGGRFAFVDYFYEPKYYGTTVEFAQYLDRLRLEKFEVRPLHEVLPLPWLLRHPKIFGKVGILYGKK